MTVSSEREPRIVIVGAGPSGCFIAGALRRALPAAQILVIDRLPCPFGLVRYGVAADHQGTKNITRQFDRIFTREGVEFAGNVLVSREPAPGAVTLEQLSATADVVVLATGLSADRALGIPGDTLPGVFGSGAITGLLNSHPDQAADDLLADLGAQVAIVGLGNVAIDLIRFLAKQADHFDGSDINDTALAAYCDSPATTIDVFSRSPITAAKCDAQMVKELGQIPGIRVTLSGVAPEAMEAGETPGDQTQAARVEALRDLERATADQDARVHVTLHFGATPERVLGSERVEGLRVLQGGEVRYIDADSVISAIGYAADANSPIQATTGSDSRIAPGRYQVGWLRRGPNGTIPENRADAVAVAAEIVADLAAGAIGRADVTAADPILPADVAAAAVNYEQWLAVDRYEREHALPGRVRTKLPSFAHMLDIAKSELPVG